MLSVNGIETKLQANARPGLLVVNPAATLCPTHTVSPGDRGQVPHHADFVLSTLTVEVWVKLPTASLVNYPVPVCKGVVNNVWSLQFDELGADKMMARVYIGGAFRTVTDPVAITRDVWTHYALTYDGATLTILKNGVVAASAAHVGAVGSSTDPLYIGDGDSLSSNIFGGGISDIRLWNVARSAAAILGDYQQRLTGLEAGLVGYWPLDDGAGRVARSLVDSPVKDAALTNGSFWGGASPF